MSNADTALRRFARANRARVESCNLGNPNVGETSRHRVKLRRDGRRITVYAADSLLNIDLRLKNDGLLAFAVNQPDRVCLLKQPLRNLPSTLRWPAFSDKSLLADMASTWIASNDGVRLISALNMSDTESLVVYRNCVSFIAEPTRDMTVLLDRLLDLARALPKDTHAETTSRVGDLPVEFRAALRTFRRWAISDDEERQEILARATAKQRRALVEAVAPLLSRIDEFLDSFGDDPQPEAALELGYLAELVAEIRARRA